MTYSDEHVISDADIDRAFEKISKADDVQLNGVTVSRLIVSFHELLATQKAFLVLIAKSITEEIKSSDLKEVSDQIDDASRDLDKITIELSRNIRIK